MTTRTSTGTVTGAARAVAEPGLLGAGPIGLVTNLTGTMPDLGRTIDAFVAAGIAVVALFSPEHGLAGTAQAGRSEPGGRDEATGLVVHDTYLVSEADLDSMVADSGAQTLVFDMQDIGLRFFTYVWTMCDCLLAAARTGVRFVVLDRPNPLTGSLTAGPVLQPGFDSFVGRAAIPLRHGLTAGELACWLNATLVPARTGRRADLRVVTVDGWRRGDWFDRTGLVWVPPSPNIPTLATALAYVGTCLFEGTTVSEGRGTTRPFECIGAPWIDHRWPAVLRAAGLPGVAFRDTGFVPSFDKYAGETCRGVQLHVTDREAFDPLRTALTMMAWLRELHPEFAVRPPSGDNGDSSRYPLDLLWGSDDLRRAIGDGADLVALLPPTDTPARVYPEIDLLYG